jgi:hypothetical protein
MNDAIPTASPAEETTAIAPAMRRICCIAAPRRPTPSPSLADQMRAAAVWAQIFHEARVAQERYQQVPDDKPGG